MSTSVRSLRLLPRCHAATLLLTLLGACNPKADQAGRSPLTVQTDTAVAATRTNRASEPLAAAAPPLPPDAMRALDAGNTAYRARKYAEAKQQYRQAAAMAPTHAAPWFGLFMVANEVKDTKLADSAMAHVKALASDPAALDAHAQVTSPNATVPTGPLPPGHPQTGQPTMPPGHPATQPTMPPGHPATQPALPPGHPLPATPKAAAGTTGKS